MPASIVRLGDGEGNILAANTTEFAAAYELGTQLILALMFGNQHFTSEQITNLRLGMEHAILTADVIGVPDKNRIAFCYHDVQLTELRKAPIDIRGTIGSLDAVRLAHLLLEKANARPAILTNCYLHRDLLPFYPQLLQKLPFLGIISCYQGIGDAVREAFNPRCIQVYTIPNQAVNVGQRPDGVHYPDRYEEIIASLRVPEAGAVFLVAAGIVGKLYCSRIKELGGIAIDIGSVADVWMGQSVRPYHSPDYLRKWRLV
jgi:hypothetical protein